MNGNLVGFRPRFSLRELLMVVSCVAFLLTLILLTRSVIVYVETLRTYNQIEYVTFSPDGKRLAVVDFRANDAGIPHKRFFSNISHTIALLDVARLSSDAVVEHELRKGIHAAARRRGPGLLVAFSGDAKHLNVLPRRGGGVRTWDIAANSWSNNHFADQSRLSGFVVSADAKWIASWSPPRGPAIWEVSTGKQAIPTSNLGWPFTFAPDGKKVAFATGTDVQVWDLNEEERTRTFHENRDSLDRVTCVTLSPDGDTVAIRCQEGLQLYSLSTCSERVLLSEDFEIIRNPTGYGTRGGGHSTKGVIFSPDGKLLAAWGSYGLKFFDMTAQCVLEREDHNTKITCFAFSPDGKTYATGDREGKVSIHSTATGKELRSTILNACP